MQPSATPADQVAEPLKSKDALIEQYEARLESIKGEKERLDAEAKSLRAALVTLGARRNRAPKPEGKRRGRPPGSKNRPKAEGEGQA